MAKILLQGQKIVGSIQPPPTLGEVHTSSINLLTTTMRGVRFEYSVDYLNFGNLRRSNALLSSFFVPFPFFSLGTGLRPTCHCTPLFTSFFDS